MKKTFYIKLSNGVGNNIFQIVSSILLLNDYKKINYVLVIPEKNYYGLTF